MVNELLVHRIDEIRQSYECFDALTFQRRERRCEVEVAALVKFLPHLDQLES